MTWSQGGEEARNHPKEPQSKIRVLAHVNNLLFQQDNSLWQEDVPNGMLKDTAYAGCAWETVCRTIPSCTAPKYAVSSIIFTMDSNVCTLERAELSMLHECTKCICRILWLHKQTWRATCSKLCWDIQVIDLITGRHYEKHSHTAILNFAHFSKYWVSTQPQQTVNCWGRIRICSDTIAAVVTWQEVWKETDSCGGKINTWRECIQAI